MIHQKCHVSRRNNGKTMKTLPDATAEEAEETKAATKRVKICMHVTDGAYDDYRVMREATALIEAGYDVTIVDIMAEVERPLDEDISDVHMKHVMMPELFIPTRFKPWFLA